MDDLASLLEAAGADGDLRRWSEQRKQPIVLLTHDSREVTPGSLFFCIPGADHDGHDHAPAAVAAGAVALVVEHELDLDVAQALVASVRAAMGPIAAAFHDRPSDRLSVVGVTGTNGKTTVVSLIEQLLANTGVSARSYGTLSGARTTPEATEFQARLGALADEGVEVAAVEVSSHALEQHRVDGTTFEVGVFTNLSPDHLDFHETMEAYAAAKAKLFAPGRVRHAIINLDDATGRSIFDTVPGAHGFQLADLVDLVDHGDHWTFLWRGRSVRLPLAGRFNVSNALAAAETCRFLGMADDDIAQGLSDVAAAPGRFEMVDVGQPFSVVVDYAHTPAGLEQVVPTATELAAGGRVLVVFGCGGDRDRAKRPLMGAAASAGADLVFVTSDNPRTEDPEAIVADILPGLDPAVPAIIELDRRAAIAAALATAEPRDVVVIAGKGHETTQTIGDAVREFDDRVVAMELLELQGHRS